MHTGTELVVSYLVVVCSLQVHLSKNPIRRYAGLPETAGVIEAAGLIEIYSDRYTYSVVNSKGCSSIAIIARIISSNSRTMYEWPMKRRPLNITHNCKKQAAIIAGILSSNSRTMYEWPMKRRPLTIAKNKQPLLSYKD